MTRPRIACCVLLCSSLLVSSLSAADPITPRLLLPGFTLRELPVKLTTLNNVEYAADGRLFAGGYDGRFHLLRDRDGDGLEEEVTTFSPTPSADYPLGMLVHDGMPHAVLANEVIRFRDSDGDGVPETRETVVKGFDDPELVAAPYLNHRRVDAAMALAYGPDGALYVTMGNAGYNNPYWTDKQGVAHYATTKRRGCLLRFNADGSVEQLASGLRYIMSLQFNRHGDLFGSDQEGATWVPNGNPFDELLHIERGRHYGFPPRHPRFLPDVVDEPSVFDYAPQHQSTCGFRFNGPLPGRGRFGPEWWSDDAFMVGAARGKLWRTAVAKTAAGYVAASQVIADFGMLAIDCAISPQGDLLVCCHTGAPDWGNGPKGAGRVFKLSYAPQASPQVVAVWASDATHTVISFDRALPAGWEDGLATRLHLMAGRSIDAGSQLETMRPGYAVVKGQQADKPQAIAISDVQVATDRTSIVIGTPAHTTAVTYALHLDGAAPLDVAHQLTGVIADWRGQDGSSWSGWLPHADLAAAQVFTRGSASHDVLWRSLTTLPGTLTLRGQFDLRQLLIPVTQPGSSLDYTPEPETATVTVAGDQALTLATTGAAVTVGDAKKSQVTVQDVQPDRWLPFTITASTPRRTLDVSYSTTRDPRARALPVRRILLPFATPAAALKATTVIAEIAGGDWQAGKALFSGKAMCAACHQLRGVGAKVGPDLANQAHRDYASLLKDIADPNATINPDAVAYQVTTNDGAVVIGTRVSETDVDLSIAQPGGVVATLKKSTITRSEPLKTSLMPPGLDKTLSATELRDLMTYLLREKPPAE